jgi:hypothetical protein
VPIAKLQTTPVTPVSRYVDTARSITLVRTPRTRSALRTTPRSPLPAEGQKERCSRYKKAISHGFRNENRPIEGKCFRSNAGVDQAIREKVAQRVLEIRWNRNRHQRIDIDDRALIAGLIEGDDLWHRLCVPRMEEGRFETGVAKRRNLEAAKIGGRPRGLLSTRVFHRVTNADVSKRIVGKERCDLI